MSDVAGRHKCTFFFLFSKLHYLNFISVFEIKKDERAALPSNRMRVVKVVSRTNRRVGEEKVGIVVGGKDLAAAAASQRENVEQRRENAGDVEWEVNVFP